jgi:hypothetical protein
LPTDLVDMDLVSIGLVEDDGRSFYAERDDFDVVFCSDFVREIVLPMLPEPGALVFSRKGLRKAVETWLAPYHQDEATICYDYSGDWARLWDLYDWQVAPWLKPRNIWENLDMVARSHSCAVNGIPEHHALNDARANAHAFLPERPALP